MKKEKKISKKIKAKKSNLIKKKNKKLLYFEKIEC